jgi:hypothetical protein
MTVPVMCLSAQARSMQIFHQHTLFHCTGDDFTIHANRYTKFSYVKQITDGIMKDIVYIYAGHGHGIRILIFMQHRNFM